MTTPPVKLSFVEKTGYGLGDAASNFFFQVSIYFLAFFYTDVFGISPAALGTMFLVVRIWDTVNDPLMGVIADRTQTRWGKFRPYMLGGAIPFGLIFAATFTTPDFGVGGKLIYAYVTYTAMLMVYTVANVPYSALMGVMTPNPEERTSLSTFRFVGAFCAAFVVQYGTLHLVTLFSGGSVAYFEMAEQCRPEMAAMVTEREGSGISVEGDSTLSLAHQAWLEVLDRGPEADGAVSALFAQSAALTQTLEAASTGMEPGGAGLLGALRENRQMGFQRTMALFGGCATLFWIVAFLTTRERVAPPPEQSNSLREDLRTLRHNRPWMVISLINLVMLIYVVIRGGSLMYFFKYTLGAESAVPNFLIANGIFSILGAWGAPRVVSWFGKKRAMLACFAIEAVCFVGTYCVHNGDWGLLWTVTIVSATANGVHSVIMWAILADSADFGEWSSGRRLTGLIFSSGLFALKTGVAVGGAVLGWYLSYIGFVPDTLQSAEAAQGLRLLHTVIPGALGVLCFLIMWTYPLSEPEVARIASDLEIRRNTRKEPVS